LRKILPLFSYLFHPIFIPVFATLLYLFYTRHYFADEQRYLIFVEVVIITILIPISFFYLLKMFGKVDSVMLSKVSQRKIPLLIQAILFIILLRKGLPIEYVPELFFFFAGGLLSTLLALLLLFVHIKASLHMLGISALTVFLIGLSIHDQTNMLYTISFLILINGIVAGSRLQMQAHTINEVSIGLFVGIIPQVLTWYFWL